MRIRPTPLAWVLIVLLAGCVLLALLGSGGAQAAGFVGGVLLVLLLAGGSARGAGAEVTRAFRGLAPQDPKSSSAAPEAFEEAGDGAWARERERRGCASG